MIALLIASIALLMQLAYELGHKLGSAIRARNDELAALHCQLLGLAPDAPKPAPAVQMHTPAPARPPHLLAASPPPGSAASDSPAPDGRHPQQANPQGRAIGPADGLLLTGDQS